MGKGQAQSALGCVARIDEQLCVGLQERVLLHEVEDELAQCPAHSARNQSSGPACAPRTESPWDTMPRGMHRAPCHDRGATWGMCGIVIW